MSMQEYEEKQREKDVYRKRVYEELRDKFAMAALTGIISSMTYEEWLDTEYDIVAENSFEMANAMMDAREKK